MSAENLIHSEINFKLLNLLKEIKYHTVLDIGAQQGQFVGQLKGKEITCLDLLENNVIQGKKRFPDIYWICDDFRTCEFLRAYDLVICLNALYYFYNKSIWSKLKLVTGKYLFLSFGDKNWVAYHGKTTNQIIKESRNYFNLIKIIQKDEHTSLLYKN